MKAKLIKKDGHYFLEVEPNTWTPPNRFHSIIANTLEKIKGDILQLSLSNCQAIECGYDLDELAREMTDKEHQLATQYSKGYEKGIVIGFQKAIEFMGDKKFSEQDVKNIFAKTLENAPSMESHTRMISDEQYRHSVMDELYDRITKSLQQTEWDVEIEMDAIPADRAPGGWDRFPKLDADGCLILKPLPKE